LTLEYILLTSFTFFQLLFGLPGKDCPQSSCILLHSVQKRCHHIFISNFASAGQFSQFSILSPRD